MSDRLGNLIGAIDAVEGAAKRAYGLAESVAGEIRTKASAATDRDQAEELGQAADAIKRFEELCYKLDMGLVCAVARDAVMKARQMPNV